MAKRKTHSQLLDEYTELLRNMGYTGACEAEGYTVTAKEWDELDKAVDKARAAIFRRMHNHRVRRKKAVCQLCDGAKRSIWRAQNTLTEIRLSDGRVVSACSHCRGSIVSNDAAESESQAFPRYTGPLPVPEGRMREIPNGAPLIDITFATLKKRR